MLDFYALYVQSLATAITCKIKFTQYVMSSPCLPHYNVYAGGTVFVICFVLVFICLMSSGKWYYLSLRPLGLGC
jgi:hypothetical protein